MGKRGLIEILTFIITFALSFKQVTFQNLLVDKVCLTECNYTKLTCTNLSNYKNEQEQVQKVVNKYQLYITFITSIPNIFCVISLGPWSDRYGRKPVVIISVMGFFLESFGVLANVLYINASVKYLLLSAVPSGLFGGLICLVAATYSYMSDISVDRTRTMRFIILESVVKLSSPCGTALGGLIFKQLGYVAVFGISSGLLTLAVVIATCLDESLNIDQQNSKKCCADIFNIKNIKSSIINSLKEHPERRQIILLVASLFLGVTAFIGIENIDYLYTKKLYGWSVMTYSNQKSVFSVGCCLTMMFISCIFLKVSSIQDSLLGLLGAVSFIIEGILKAVAFKPIVYYAASAVGMASGIIAVATRSVLSKLVEDKHGAVFSLLAICEACSPLFAGVIFLEIYNATYSFFDGSVYCIGAFLQVFTLTVFVWLLNRKPNISTPLLTSGSHSSLEEEQLIS